MGAAGLRVVCIYIYIFIYVYIYVGPNTSGAEGVLL